MAKALRMSTRAFRKRHVRRVGSRLSLREEANGDCTMLENKRCRVYAAKPQRCTTFPFWGPVVESAAMWRETALRCEGIDQGDFYASAEIERLLAGDPTPLVEKHRRPPESPVVSRVAVSHVPSARALVRADAKPTPPLATRLQSAAPRQEESAPRESSSASSAPIDWAAAYAALELLYEEVAAAIPATGMTCAASGACCDFAKHGHRLFATRLEAAWFFACSGARVNQDPTLCPAWGADRLCHERRGRMLGCRTYFCGPYPRSRPEDLHEPFHARLKELHERFAIPYDYRDILDWAREFAPV